MAKKQTELVTNPKAFIESVGKTSTPFAATGDLEKLATPTPAEPPAPAAKAPAPAKKVKVEKPKLPWDEADPTRKKGFLLRLPEDLDLKLEWLPHQLRGKHSKHSIILTAVEAHVAKMLADLQKKGDA